MGLWTVAIWGGAIALGAGPYPAKANTAPAIPAVILKVEGDGIANVRKHSGVMESAGARGKVYPGDKVITDARSAVYLLLPDGSLLKVGFNSELNLDSVENHGAFLSWLFSLLRGEVRALVEKIPADEPHLRVTTPTGTIGVRGTEFVLAHEPATALTSLYTIEGTVDFGAVSCEQARSCLAVRDGEMSGWAKGQNAPAKPVAYSAKDLLGLSGTGGDRLSLFREARKATQPKTLPTDEGALGKALRDASAELAEAQDRAIGRSRGDRAAHDAAIKNKVYTQLLGAADAYAEAHGIFETASNGGAEDLVGTITAAKLRLGQAVVSADVAGLFADKPAAAGPKAAASPWAGRAFKERKTFDYEMSAAAKVLEGSLRQFSGEYRDALVFAEAYDANQFTRQASGEGGGPGTRPTARRSPCDAACVARRIDHEMDVISEGAVAAFSGKTPELASKAPSSKRGRGGLPSAVSTKYFSRTVSGDSCVATEKICRPANCSSLPRAARAKCSPGDKVELCDAKAIPVRCPDAPTGGSQQ